MMLSLPQFLLESSICLALFYTFYYWILRKETFFQLNRIYLIATPLLSVIIPLLNINLAKPSSAQSASSLEQFIYPAVSNASAVNQLLWQQIDSPTPAFSLTIADILMTVYLLGVLWMSTRLFHSLFNLWRLIRQNRQEKGSGYTMIETQTDFPAASFFSYIFWNKNKITEQKRLILEHELVHIRQWHSIDVLLMELWVIIKWFNPLIYLYRKSLQATHEYIADHFVAQKAASVHEYASLMVQHNQDHACNRLVNTFSALIKKRLLMLGQNQSANWKALKYLWSFPLLVGLMLLFSFNLVEELPENSLSDSLSNINTYLEDLGDKTVLEIERTPFYQHHLEWGGVVIPLHTIDDDNALNLQVESIHPEAFTYAKNGGLQLFQGYNKETIKDIDIHIETKQGQVFNCQNDLNCFYKTINNLERDFSIFFKISTSPLTPYFAALTISEADDFYGSNFSPSTLYDKITSAKYSVSNNMVRLVDLYNHQKQDYFLEWGDERFQAIKVGTPLLDPIDIKTISIADFQQLRQQNFTLIKENSCMLIDSVFTMVAGEDEALFRCKDKWSDLSCYRDFLYEVNENASIYLILKTHSGELYSSIISIGEESTLYLEDEEFVSQLLQFPTPKFAVDKLIYKDNNYELLWGDLYIELKKAHVNSGFSAEIDVNRNNWIKALQTEPTLRLQHGSLFDELKFFIKTATYRKNSDNPHIHGSIVKVSPDSSIHYSNGSFLSYAQNLKAGDQVFISNLSYGEWMPDILNITINITDDENTLNKSAHTSTKPTANVYYQFHWGGMKMELNQKEKFNTDFHISKTQFLHAIKHEPVFSSSQNGVFFDFEFDLKVAKKTTKKYTIQSHNDKPDDYKKSIPNEQLAQLLEAGDQVQLTTINAEGIQDKLSINIHITSETTEDRKKRKSLNKTILDWGDLELNPIQLNKKTSDKAPAIQSIALDFFNTIKCNEPHLYHDGDLLNIKEVSLIIRGKDYEYSCQHEHWADRACMLEKFSELKENAEVSLFLKTSANKNFRLQFRVKTQNAEEDKIIAYGNTSSLLFDELSKKYATETYKNKTDAKEVADSLFNVGDIVGKWGDLAFPFENKPSFFNQHIAKQDITLKDLETVLNKPISLEYNGEKVTIKRAGIWGRKASERYRLLDDVQISLECYKNKCYFPYEQLDLLMDKVYSNVVSDLTIYFEQDVINESIALGGIRLHILNPNAPWEPEIRIKKPKLDGSTYPFQMVNRKNRNTLVRIDTTNEKYRWMVDSYSENPTVELIHIPDFKTIKRVIDHNDNIIPKENIKKVEILMKQSFDSYSYPEFYDLKDKEIQLSWRDFKGTFRDSVYCIDDFQNNTQKLQLNIDGKLMEIKQFELLIVPETGKNAKYITDSAQRKEILKAIKALDTKSSLYINKVLIEDESGAFFNFPLSFVFNLE